MNPNEEPPQRWNKVSAALRKSGAAKRPPDEDLCAPPGFATRIVARFQADGRADAAGLARWRRWSLAGAMGALLLFGGSFLLTPPQAPAKSIIPVPALDRELPDLASR